MSPPYDPTCPPSHTGDIWKEPDGTIRGEISDIYGQPVWLVLEKKGHGFTVRGWRGPVPTFEELKARHA